MVWRRVASLLIWLVCFVALMKPMYCKSDLWYCSWSPYPWAFPLSLLAVVLLIVDLPKDYRRARRYFSPEETAGAGSSHAVTDKRADT